MGIVSCVPMAALCLLRILVVLTKPIFAGAALYSCPRLSCLSTEQQLSCLVLVCFSGRQQSGLAHESSRHGQREVVGRQVRRPLHRDLRENAHRRRRFVLHTCARNSQIRTFLFPPFSTRTLSATQTFLHFYLPLSYL